MEVHDDRHNPKAVSLPISSFTPNPVLPQEVWKSGFWDKKGDLWLMSDQRILRRKNGH